MIKNQRNHRNTTIGKVNNVATARPISHQKQPSTNEMQQQTSDPKESNLIQKQQKIIEELLDRLERLEGTVWGMEGELAAARKVNTILSQQRDEADQYCWRSRMIVTGLRKPGKDETNDEDSKRVISAIASEAGLDEEKLTKHVDKVNPVGGTKNGKQSRIIKFTTHSLKEKICLKHKQNKKNDTEKRKENAKLKSRIQLNDQPSLSRFRIELLRKANEAIEDNANFKFAYANMHGNLKYILNNPLNGKYVKHFRNENDIIDIVSAYCEKGEFWSIFSQFTSYMCVR